MRYSILKIVAGFFLLLISNLSANADDFVFHNVTALTMGAEGRIENAVVITSDDSIIYVGPREGADIPDNATMIDGQGGYIMPGLGEMHGHVPGGDEVTQLKKDILFLYVARGVTTVRGMLGDPLQFTMRRRIHSGDLVGPNLYLAAPSLSGGSVTSVAQATRLTERYSSEKWDLLKIHPGLTRDEYLAIAETANAHDLDFGGHVPEDVSIDLALESGQISFDHIDGYLRDIEGAATRLLNQEDFEPLIQKTLEKGAWIVPTQILFRTLNIGGNIDEFNARPELQYIPERDRNSFENRLRSINNNITDANRMIAENRDRLLLAMVNSGVHIALGSDAPQLYSVPGFSILREMDYLASIGIDAEKILTFGTSAVGEYFSDRASFGTLEAGKRADILLLAGDPTENITNIWQQQGVMVAGRWLPKAFIDQKLEEIAARYR